MVRRNRGGNTKVEAKKDVVKSKAISLKTLVVATVIGCVGLATLGAAEVHSKDQPEPPSKAEILAVYREANAAKNKAHYWAHKRKAGHKYHRTLSPVTNSLTTEIGRANNWKAVAKSERMAYVKYAKEEKAKAIRLAAANRDFHLALKLASKHYNVSYSWLHACAHSEGHIDGRRPGYNQKDPFIMNHQGSGAGGWMQFMESTFYGNIHGANPIPLKYRKWNNRVGQAYVAAYMFKIGQSRQWAGAGC